MNIMTRPVGSSPGAAARRRGVPKAILNESSDVSLFVQIAQFFITEIRSGRMVSGATLPGARTLAHSLGVHRNTVSAAYKTLLDEGWVSGASRRRLTVLVDQRALGFRSPQLGFRADVPAEVSFSYARTPMRTELNPKLYLGDSSPDPALFPAKVFAQAVGRVLRQKGDVVGRYGSPLGYEPLRSELARMLASTRRLACSSDNVLCTSGSQMGLSLVLSALVSEGEHFAVEALTYPLVRQLLIARGAVVHDIPVDGSGLIVDELKRLAAQHRLRGVYITPHHQYPTTVTMSAGRRTALLALAKRHRFPIIEDDYDHEFHYEGRPVPPLASADTAGVVVYIGSLSKVLLPTLRIGYVVAPSGFVEQLAQRRSLLDRQGNTLIEAAVADLFQEGELQRHLGRSRRTYLGRRDAFATALRERFEGKIAFQVPRGGLAFWVTGFNDFEAWTREGARLGWRLFDSAQFASQRSRGRRADSDVSGMRIGFASIDPARAAKCAQELWQIGKSAGWRG